MSFEKTGSRLVATISTGDGEEVYRFKRSFPLRRGRSFWFSCAQVLVSLESIWALPGNAATEITVQGCSGIPADVLAICWTRLDDDEYCFGADVLKLKGETLRRMTRQLGSVRRNQMKWHGVVARISDAQADLGLKSDPVRFLNSVFCGKSVNIEKIISRLEAKSGNKGRLASASRENRRNTSEPSKSSPPKQA